MYLGILTFLTAIAIWPGVPTFAWGPRWFLAAAGSAAYLFVVRIRPTPAHWWGLAFLLAAAASYFWIDVKLEWYEGFIWYLGLAAAFLVGAEVKDLRPVWWGLGAGLSINGLIALAQFFGYDYVPYINVPAGLFGNRVFMGEAAALALVGSVACRFWYFVPGSILALGLSQSRGALLGVLGCGMIWLWKHWKGGVMVLLIALPFFALASTGIVLPGTNKGASTMERVYLWSDSIDGLKPFGNGVGSFYTAAVKYGHRTQTTGLREAHAHNDVLEAFFELGILAIPLMVIFWMALFGPLTTERYVLWCFVLVGLTGFPLHAPLTGFVGSLVAGYLVRGRYSVPCPVSLGYVDDSSRVTGAFAQIHQVWDLAKGCCYLPLRLLHSLTKPKYVISLQDGGSKADHAVRDYACKAE